MKNILSPAKLQTVKKGSAFAFELLAQRITGIVDVGFVSDDMLRGQDDEITAREIYSKEFSSVEQVGFITEVINGVRIGYSPDGLVGEDGLVEIKSRRDKYQIETIIADEVPQEYMLQIQTGLLVTGRKWLDFISYASGLPLFVKRVFPCEKYFEKIKLAIDEFETELLEYWSDYDTKQQTMIKTERKTYNDEVDFE
jgi:predicted phage-related endonuclease